MKGTVVNIQGYSIHDGPGIRTTVFLKGCSLACQWCSNPECISPQPEVGLFETLCTKCSNCADVCPKGAISFKTGEVPVIDRRLCNGCGECISVCKDRALVLYGKQMSVQEVFDAISRDSIFYKASDGGITASGGEPLLQPQFVGALFDRCRRAGIHTCLETAGYADSSDLQQVLSSTDYVLYDLKHMNSSMHRRFTGRPNDLVLANAKLIVESGVKVLFRRPLIPGINDSLEEIQETAAFLKGLGGNMHHIEFLPYHRLGESKYKALGKRFPLYEIQPPEMNHVDSARRAFDECGIHCTISK